MQISITAENSSKQDAIGKYQDSGNDRIVRDTDSGRAWAQISQKHRDMTGEHECMNWQNLGINDTDGKQDRQGNKKIINVQKQDRHSDHNIFIPISKPFHHFSLPKKWFLGCYPKGLKAIPDQASSDCRRVNLGS